MSFLEKVSAEYSSLGGVSNYAAMLF